MSLRSSMDRLDEEQLRQEDFFVTKTATCTLKPYERLVFIDSSGGATAVTITLPPVAEMRGKLLVLYASAEPSGTITIAAADSVDFSAPTFDGVDDGQLLYSDGIHWWALATRT